MIRKFGTVDAPVEAVRKIFSDLEAWPQWMPDVRAVRVRERSGTRAVAEIDRIHRRQVKTTTFEFVFNPSGHRERQLEGRARRWESDWRFEIGPEHKGTLVSCRLDLDMGLIGLLAPSKMIQRWIDRTFERTIQRLREQTRHAALAKPADRSAAEVVTASSIRVFVTPTELEIWIGDRKYVARAAD